MKTSTAELPKPQFTDSDRPIQRELNRRVAQYFRASGLSPKAPRSLKLKALSLYLTFFILYSSFFILPQTFISVFLTAFGIVMVVFLLGMNVMHDCAHGTYFKGRLAIALGLCTWDLFGVSGDIYRLKHLDVHHEFTNITGWDGDMDLSYPALRLNPNLPWLPIHRYQKYYGPLLYTLLTISWIFFSDFLAIKKLKVCNFTVKPFKKTIYLKMLSFKALHFFLFIILPSFYFPFVNVLATFIFVQLALGLSFSLIFQVAHINEKAAFELSESGAMINEWAVHQLLTSSNFATKSQFWRFALGGLNFQIEHHLFPSICHVHYPKISEIVRSVCDENSIPYREYPTFAQAVASHLRLIARLGVPDSKSFADLKNQSMSERS